MGFDPWIVLNYLAWQLPQEMESDKNVSACDWPKFAGRLTRPQWQISRSSSVIKQGSAQVDVFIEALAVTAVAQ